jgi:hypothetical protein
MLITVFSCGQWKDSCALLRNFYRWSEIPCAEYLVKSTSHRCLQSAPRFQVLTNLILTACFLVVFNVAAGVVHGVLMAVSSTFQNDPEASVEGLAPLLVRALSHTLMKPSQTSPSHLSRATAGPQTATLLSLDPQVCFYINFPI